MEDNDQIDAFLEQVRVLDVHLSSELTVRSQTGGGSVAISP